MLKYRFLFIVVVLAYMCGNRVNADEPAIHPNIVDVIEAESEGNITIEISDDLKGKLDFFVPSDAQKKQQGPKVVKRANEGYRIQVFSDGSDQRTLKARAQARANAIVARFPKYRGQVYTFSKSPNWYCQIGNFESQADANKAMSELRGAFPQFSGEFRIVKCNIVLR